jgi:hypothetical protein
VAFEVASTNLVVELGVIMALILGWQFTLAEFVGACGVRKLVSGQRGCIRG